MIDIIICGINSKNGQSLYKCALESDNVNVTCGIDNETIGEFQCPVYKEISQVKHDVDVIIDFSGAALGIALSTLVFLLICRIKKKRTEKNEERKIRN